MEGDFLLALQKARGTAYRGFPCGVKRIEETLNEKDFNGLLEAINDKTVSMNLLSDICRQHDIDLSNKTISAHRNKRCRCFIESRR